MRYITWESDNGRTVEMSKSLPYLFGELTDRMGANAEISRAPRQDGQITHYATLATHTINVTGSVVAFGNKNNNAQAVFDRMKSDLSQAFAPNRSGLLIYHREDGDAQIRCRPLAIPTFGSRHNNSCTVDIELESDASFWEKSVTNLSTIGGQEKMWRFPMAFKPLVFGAFYPFGRIENPTAETIYPEIEITSTSQTVRVENSTTGLFIELNRPIMDNQKMVIQTEDASAAIWERTETGGWEEKENVSHWLTLDSNPWGLIPGVNVVKVSNEIPEETPITNIRYRLPVLGV